MQGALGLVDMGAPAPRGLAPNGPLAHKRAPAPKGAPAPQWAPAPGGGAHNAPYPMVSRAQPKAQLTAYPSPEKDPTYFFNTVTLIMYSL